MQLSYKVRYSCFLLVQDLSQLIGLREGLRKEGMTLRQCSPYLWKIWLTQDSSPVIQDHETLRKEDVFNSCRWLDLFSYKLVFSPLSYLEFRVSP